MSVLVKNKGTVSGSFSNDFHDIVEISKWNIPNNRRTILQQTILENDLKEARRLKVLNEEKVSLIV